MFVGVEAGDLSCHEGDLIIVTEAHGGVASDTHTWWEGHVNVQSEPSRIGEFPSGLTMLRLLAKEATRRKQSNWQMMMMS